MVIDSKYDGYCSQCKTPVKVGDRVEWIKKLRKGVRCLDCVAGSLSGGPRGWAPNRHHQSPYQASVVPPPPFRPTPPPAPAAKPGLSTLALNALVALEALLIEAAVANNSPEKETGWKRYQACKALALGAKTPGEERAALKQAVLQAVKLAF
jgi:hypothetical protein